MRDELRLLNKTWLISTAIGRIGTKNGKRLFVWNDSRRKDKLMDFYKMLLLYNDSIKKEKRTLKSIRT